MPLGELLYESADIAYDTVSKNYINPKDNSIYGTQPPTGGWAVNWYMGSDNTPVVVSGNQTVAQITQQLASQNVVASTNETAAPVSFWSGQTFGVSNGLLVGGVVVAGLLLMMRGK